MLYEDINNLLTYEELVTKASIIAQKHQPSPISLAHHTPIDVLAHLVGLADRPVAVLLDEIDLNTLNQNDVKTELSVVFTTSGTTGTPKVIEKKYSDLTRTIQKNFESKSPPLHWGLLYDPSKMAGLQVVLSAFHRKESLYCPDISKPLSNRIKEFNQRKINALSATPSMWRTLLQIPSFLEMNLKQITLGGEKTDSNLISTLSSKFPGARITQIYATSELGVIFSVKDGKEGFPIEFLEPPSNSEGKLRVEQGLLQVYRGGAWISTGDRVAVEKDRVLFLGRSEDIVNVGGVKVDPSLVRNTILELAEVIDCVVCGISNPILGQILVAEVVKSSGSMINEFAIKDYLGARVRKIEIPAVIRFVDEISMNSNGKRRLST